MKRFLSVMLLLFIAGMLLPAQDTENKVVSLSGNVTGIYTLGNAAGEQALAMQGVDGAYVEQKNGYYVQSNLYAEFKPVSFLTGYFKLTGTARPGSFYVPLSLEPASAQNFELVLDRMYGSVSVLEALNVSAPIGLSLYLKTGKYSGEASRYQIHSKYELENILANMETANTYNYEVELTAAPLNNDFTVSASFVGNYRFDEALPRLYDNDGGKSDHGNLVLGEYDGQFMTFVRFFGLDLAGGELKGEFIFGRNVAGIYSGNAVGGDLSYDVQIKPDTFTLPVGLALASYEKNIDVLSRSANTSGISRTIDFRNSFNAALSLGARYKAGDFGVNANLAGAFSQIEHIYREPLIIPAASLDLQVSYRQYFIGGGLVLGTLSDAQWKTSDAFVTKPTENGGIDHTFTVADNMGYEFYAGLQLYTGTRFVIGFNRNKGLGMNYNLENKPEGQMKYALADQDGTSTLPLYESGGIYLKFVMSF